MSLVHSIQENFWPKAFSLILATFIWLVVNSNVQNKTVEIVTPSQVPVSRNFARPIAIRWLGEGEAPEARARPGSIQLTLAGEPAILDRVRPEETHAFIEINASDIVPGIFPIQVTHPRGLTPTLVLPCAVRVEIVAPAKNGSPITETNRVQPP